MEDGEHGPLCTVVSRVRAQMAVFDLESQRPYHRIWCCGAGFWRYGVPEFGLAAALPGRSSSDGKSDGFITRRSAVRSRPPPPDFLPRTFRYSLRKLSDAGDAKCLRVVPVPRRKPGASFSAALRAGVHLDALGVSGGPATARRCARRMRDCSRDSVSTSVSVPAGAGATIAGRRA